MQTFSHIEQRLKMNEQSLHSREYIKGTICQNGVVFHTLVTHVSVFVAHDILSQILSKIIFKYQGRNTKVGIHINL